MVIMYGGRRLKNILIDFRGNKICSKDKIKGLGVYFDDNTRMAQHIIYAIENAEKSIEALAKLMPRTGGPNANKRRALSGVRHSILLYAALIWEKCLKFKTYRKTWKLYKEK